jgi:hypothetical protein
VANRFTDSRKWDDPWFRKLPCKYKAFWIFLLDKCDHAGIWKVDYESASFHIGEDVGEEARGIMNGRIYEYKDKWFIPKFIFFQYGFLSDINRVHKSVVEILEKEGLYKVYKQTLIGLKDKDKDKDKDKYNINNDTDKYNINITDREKQLLINMYGTTITKEYIDRLKDYAAQFPDKFKKYASHYATIRNWMRRDSVKKLPPKLPEPPKEELRHDPKVAELIHQTVRSMK